jgi:hypothetical protein
MKKLLILLAFIPLLCNAQTYLGTNIRDVWYENVDPRYDNFSGMLLNSCEDSTYILLFDRKNIKDSCNIGTILHYNVIDGVINNQTYIFRKSCRKEIIDQFIFLSNMGSVTTYSEDKVKCYLEARVWTRKK